MAALLYFQVFSRGFSAETTFSRTFGLHRGHVLADAARSSGRSDRALGADSSSVLTSVFVHTGAGLLWFLIKPKVRFSFQHIDLCERTVKTSLLLLPDSTCMVFCIWFHHTPDWGDLWPVCVCCAELQKCMTETAVISHSSVLMKTHFPNSQLSWTLRFSHIKTKPR